MPQFSTKRRVRHAATDMFELVADVDQYPKFVPFCRSMRVRKRSEDARGRPTIVCEMTIAYKMIRETFTTLVTLDRTELQIIVDYLSGPFRKLENRWRFLDAGHGTTRIEFDIDFAFKSRILEALLRANFHQAVEKLIGCFEARARTLYGDAAPVQAIAGH